MALLIPAITLSSGLTLTNALMVISELHVNNNTSSTERLDFDNSPSDGEAVNPSYKLMTSNHGGTGCTYMVSVFLDNAAFDSGKPPIEQLKDGRNTKVFSVNLAEPAYAGMTPRQAAYTHLLTQTGFEAGTAMDGVEV